GEFAPVGDVNGKVQLVSRNGRKSLTFDVSSDINNLTAGSGSNEITQASVTLKVQGSAKDFNQFELSNYSLGVARQNQELVNMTGSGTYDKKADAADLQLKGRALLAQVLQVLGRPDLSASSGTAEFTAH